MCFIFFNVTCTHHREYVVCISDISPLYKLQKAERKTKVIVSSPDISGFYNLVYVYLTNAYFLLILHSIF